MRNFIYVVLLADIKIRAYIKRNGSQEIRQFQICRRSLWI